MMRELTVKVSDSQFETLVNFLRTLPYVQVPSVFKKSPTTEPFIENEQTANIINSDKSQFDIALLGEMDMTPFDIDDIKKNHSIKWEQFHEIVAIFKDIPLEKCIEQHTELHID
jgi:hypothetical protein